MGPILPVRITVYVVIILSSPFDIVQSWRPRPTGITVIASFVSVRILRYGWAMKMKKKTESKTMIVIIYNVLN